MASRETCNPLLCAILPFFISIFQLMELFYIGQSIEMQRFAMIIIHYTEETADKCCCDCKRIPIAQRVMYVDHVQLQAISLEWRIYTYIWYIEDWSETKPFLPTDFGTLNRYFHIYLCIYSSIHARTNWPLYFFIENLNFSFVEMSFQPQTVNCSHLVTTALVCTVQCTSVASQPQLEALL